MPIIIFCLGLGSIISQFVFLRELQTTFQGNELSLSLILFSWLFGSGMGGLLGFFLSSKKGKSIHPDYLKSLLSLILILSALWLFISLFLSRGLKPFLSISPFEILQPGQILLISAIVIVPQTITVGLSFILICSIIQNPLKAYLLEALGAFFAGLLSLILIKYSNSSQIIWGIAIIYTASGLLLLNEAPRAKARGFLKRNTERPLFIRTLKGAVFWPRMYKKRQDYRLLLIMWVSYSILSLAMLSKFEKSTQNLRFKPQKLIYSTDSIYANIAVVKNSGHSYSLYENGKLSFSTEDSESIEEWTHMLLLSHPAPRKILLIGGGVSGVIFEILKHPIESIDYLEPDKKLIETVLKHIPQSAAYGLKDKKVDIYNQDARLFIKAALNKYDLIILNLGGPSSLQLNRFYTKEFFEEIKKILSPEGRFCFSFESKEDILSGQLLKYNTCLYKSAQSAFPYLQLIPGERLTLIGSSQALPKIDPENLSQKFKERNILTTYFTPYHIKAKLFRQEYIQKKLEENSHITGINPIRSLLIPPNYPTASIGVNRDYQPLGFFSYLSLRGKQNRLNFNRIWEFAGKIKLIYWISAALILAGFGRGHIVNLSVFSSGFYGISLEIVISLLFQINLGFLYYRLGMIVANFMLGLSLGGILFMRLEKTGLSWKRALFLSEIALGIISLSCAFILKDNQLTYFLLTLLVGIIIGFEFGIFYSREKTITVYILDLSGACLGSLLTGLIFVPVLGVYNTCLLISSGKLISAFFLRIQKR